MHDIEYIRQRLDYDPETGVFTWRVKEVRCKQDRGFNTTKAGRRAGTTDPSRGYRFITIRPIHYYEHRLAWAYVCGEWPDLVDHINGDCGDNRIANLRAASVSQNGFNRGAARTNKVGLKGVSQCPMTGRWLAKICSYGDRRFLGRYDSPAEAHQAYASAAAKLHGEFARLSKAHP